MIARLKIIYAIIKQQWLTLLLFTIVFTLAYYLILLLSLIARFGDLPNYINSFPWLDNITTIIHSTPSLKDTLLIAKDEWLLEIGFMNYDFGPGISEWSLFVAPVKMLGVALLGALLATLYFLVAQNKKHCSVNSQGTVKASAGIGASLVALASVTMSWVVCCSYPTWVVGLSMMGLGVSTSLWLEPLGIFVNVLGFLLLLTGLLIAAKPSQSFDKSNHHYSTKSKRHELPASA